MFKVKAIMLVCTSSREKEKGQSKGIIVIPDDTTGNTKAYHEVSFQHDSMNEFFGKGLP